MTVVSGLAIGIDGAAHEGALDAGGLAVGVVATGLDVTYPRRHRALYARVREHGLVVGEHGYGVQPSRERFPVRNRIIAALADVVVVVEATATGGARITAGYAAEYGRDVFALPGLAPQSGRRGLQRADRRRRRGAARSRRPADRARPGRQPARALGARPGRTGRPTGDEAAVLHALGGDPATIDDLERNTHARPGPARSGAEPPRAGRPGPAAAGPLVADADRRGARGTASSFSFSAKWPTI